MERKSTNFQDQSGKTISVGDKVILDGEVYEVMVNDFNGQFVLDNELGQGKLSDIHHKCTVVEVTEETIDNLIDQWHESKVDMPIYEFLGLSEEQYAFYVETGIYPRISDRII